VSFAVEKKKKRRAAVGRSARITGTATEPSWLLKLSRNLQEIANQGKGRRGLKTGRRRIESGKAGMARKSVAEAWEKGAPWDAVELHGGGEKPAPLWEKEHLRRAFSGLHYENRTNWGILMTKKNTGCKMHNKKT